MRHITRGVGAAVLAVSLALTTVACATESDGEGAGTGVVDAPAAQVAVDSDGSGIESAGALLTSATVAVVAEPEPGAQSRAASAAIGLRAPMFTAVDGGEAARAEELQRLGVDRVLVVGDVDVAADGIEVVRAPGDREALEELTGVEFASELEVAPGRVDDHLVHQTPGEPALLVAGEYEADDSAEEAVDPFEPGEPAWSGDDAPRVLVHAQTPIPAIATAVAAGAVVSHLRAPDPRVDGGSVDAVRDAETVIALGPDWGDDDELAERLDQARTVPELPGGGQLHFPGHRYIAAYGSPITPALGILGEQGPEASVERVEQLVEQYQPHSRERVIPAFEIIATVAAQAPGEDGNYTNEWPPEEFEPLVDAITDAGGYAVIDLQPGMADFVDQAKIFEDLLKRPGVGLALDPEWKLEPGQQPGAQIGSVDAEEINRVIDWLADLTRDSGGPQTLLILHQFNMNMITNRDQIDTSRPELAISLHADGHGTPDLKMETWDVLREGLSPDIWMAWKNFYDEDTPTFSPQETMAVSPRPWFVSYQ